MAVSVIGNRYGAHPRELWVTQRHEVIAFEPSERARQRVWQLLELQKTAPLPADEKAELDHYIEIEHLMRLAKARARQLLAHG